MHAHSTLDESTAGVWMTGRSGDFDTSALVFSGVNAVKNGRALWPEGSGQGTVREGVFSDHEVDHRRPRSGGPTRTSAIASMCDAPDAMDNITGGRAGPRAARR